MAYLCSSFTNSSDLPSGRMGAPVCLTEGMWSLSEGSEMTASEGWEKTLVNLENHIGIPLSIISNMTALLTFPTVWWNCINATSRLATAPDLKKCSHTPSKKYQQESKIEGSTHWSSWGVLKIMVKHCLFLLKLYQILAYPGFCSHKGSNNASLTHECSSVRGSFIDSVTE